VVDLYCLLPHKLAFPALVALSSVGVSRGDVRVSIIRHREVAASHVSDHFRGDDAGPHTRKLICGLEDHDYSTEAQNQERAV
jgi:hypothetical protein